METVTIIQVKGSEYLEGMGAGEGTQTDSREK